MLSAAGDPKSGFLHYSRSRVDVLYETLSDKLYEVCNRCDGHRFGSAGNRFLATLQRNRPSVVNPPIAWILQENVR